MNESERGYTIIKDEDGTYHAYRGVPFGLATARFCGGASLQQSLATLKRATGARITALQTYVDDPVIVCAGSQEERTQQLAVTLLGWAALGVRMALHKLHRGQTVPWIGVEFNILPSGLQISF